MAAERRQLVIRLAALTELDAQKASDEEDRRLRSAVSDVLDGKLEGTNIPLRQYPDRDFLIEVDGWVVVFEIDGSVIYVERFLRAKLPSL
jgi:hypothetical protein